MSAVGGASSKNDPAKQLIRLCIRVAQRVNKGFLWTTGCLQVLVVPQVSAFQRRAYWLYFVQLLTCDLVLVVICKLLQTYYRITNFLLLLSVASLAPFMRAVYDLWTFIPCPPMAAVISNLALVFSLVVLIALGVGTYEGDFWIVYAYLMTAWPWLVLISMLSRLYIERNVGKNPFSAVKELPVLGLMGAGAQVLTFLAAKEISVTDCVVYMSMDSIWAALLASCLLGKARLKMHFRSAKVYASIVVIILFYNAGDLGPGIVQVKAPTYGHALFALARLLVVMRSIFVKYAYASFNHAEAPERPPESGLIFYATERPKKNRFKNFPAPVLLTLDAIFDSGLRDSELHGMGALGTQDLYMLTDFTYVLPFASLMAFMNEFDTLTYGILPPSMSNDPTSSAESVVSEGAGLEPAAVTENFGASDVLLVVVLLLLLCAARYFTGWAMSQALFDRGSPLHAWQYQPLLVVMPFFIFDVLYLNESLSKFQIVAVLLLAAVVAHYRSNLWNSFKRKYLLLCTQELHYHQPAVLRSLQRRTLLEFMERTSTEDYGFMLMETSIRHGQNIKELARDTSVVVWDPAPTATASWKLAVSLVTKSLRRQKMVRQKKLEAKEEVYKYINDVVLGMVFRAVDVAAGHGGRLRLAGALSGVISKRRAIRELKALADRRRTMRRKKRTGELSAAPMALATAGGTIRSIRDIPAQQPGRLPQPPGGVPGGPGPTLSLTASQDQQSGGASGEMHALLAVPGGLPGGASDDDAAAFAKGAGPTGRGDSAPRGVFWQAGDRARSAASMAGSVVLAFGDPRRGQLGVEPGPAAQQALKTSVITVVEELRGSGAVQVVAAGVASFVTGSRGQVWAFGSNRSMELGTRKEVTQVNNCQRVKSLRDHMIVQVAGCCSASGQAFTIGLTHKGEVYTFGTSAVGALGQGAEVRQTAPLLLRMSTQVRVRSVCAGARHSMMITDEGKLFAVGDNRHGQLGTASRMQKCVDFQPVEGELAELKVNLLACGDDHVLATVEDGRLFSWGSNANGQLGLCRLDDQALPQVIRDIQSLAITSLACGSRHSLVVTSNGLQVYSFGSNTQGQLGVGESNAAEGYQLSQPTLIPALTKQPHMEIVQVAAAASHSLAVTLAGEVYSFGDNTYGQLGFNTEGSGVAAGSAAGSTFGASGGFGASQRQASIGQSRMGAHIDKPRTLAEGVARLWTPVRVAGLSLYQIRCVSTADMHSLAIAA